MRVCELARELKLSNAQVMAKINEPGDRLRTPSSSLTDAEILRIRKDQEPASS